MAGVAAATAVGMGVTPGLTAAPAIAASTTGTAEYEVNLAADPQVIVDIPDLLAQLGIDLDELSVADLDPAQLGLGDVLKEAGIEVQITGTDFTTFIKRSELARDRNDQRANRKVQKPIAAARAVFLNSHS